MTIYILRDESRVVTDHVGVDEGPVEAFVAAQRAHEAGAGLAVQKVLKVFAVEVSQDCALRVLKEVLRRPSGVYLCAEVSCESELEVCDVQRGPLCEVLLVDVAREGESLVVAGVVGVQLCLDEEEHVFDLEPFLHEFLKGEQA